MPDNKHTAFPGRLVILGFGSIGQGVLPLLLRHIDLKPDQITIITAELRGHEVAAEYGVRFVETALTRENYRPVLQRWLGPGDFLLLDSWIPLVRPVMDMMVPQLRPGAVVICDNVEMYEREYSDYTSFIRDPRNGFRSVLLSHQGGLEISVKLG